MVIRAMTPSYSILGAHNCCGLARRRGGACERRELTWHCYREGGDCFVWGDGDAGQLGLGDLEHHHVIAVNNAFLR